MAVEWILRHLQPDNKILRITKKATCSTNDMNSSEEREEEATEEDDEILHRSPNDFHNTFVVYDIIHSPSYQVPVLYVKFQSNGSSLRRQPSLDEAYEQLTPSPLQGQMQKVGVLGALSMTEHPITGMTAFFVHPCRTAEAMREITGDAETTPEKYLMLWMGLIGQSVGLTVPMELARSMSTSM